MVIVVKGEFSAIELSPRVRYCDCVAVFKVDELVGHLKMHMVGEAAGTQLECSNFDSSLCSHDSEQAGCCVVVLVEESGG